MGYAEPKDDPVVEYDDGAVRVLGRTDLRFNRMARGEPACAVFSFMMQEFELPPAPIVVLSFDAYRISISSLFSRPASAAPTIPQSSNGLPANVASCSRTMSGP